MADTKTATPKFGAIAEPPPRIRGGEVVLSKDEATALVAAISESGWASDGLVYADPQDAYGAANRYRRALKFYGLEPQGQTLGSRANVVEGEGVVLYLRWRTPRAKNGAPKAATK